MRQVECPLCDGERGWDIWTGYDPRDGSPTGYFQTCNLCNGNGEIWVEMPLITLDDLEHLHA